MLGTVRGRVGAAVARGESVEQLLAGGPTSEFDPEWGGGFLTSEQFIRIVYADLSRGIAAPPAP